MSLNEWKVFLLSFRPIGDGRFRIGTVFDHIAGLALQFPAYRLQRGETDGLGLSVFEDRQVGRRNIDAAGQFAERHLALGHHDVYIDDQSHISVH